MILNIFLTLVLVLLNGFFVAAEFALVKVRHSQIEILARSGSKSAVITKLLINHLDEYLSATQLGITLASLGLGWIGEPVVSVILIDIMNFFGADISVETAHQIALPLAFALITGLHIVFGELAPKSMAIQKTESLALLTAYPLRAFYLVFKPFIWILNASANGILGILGFKPASEEETVHSSEELRLILEESSKSGMIDEGDRELIENVFDFSDTPIKQIIVPRGRVSAIELSATVTEAVRKFKSEGYSRMPVYDKSIDNIAGVIYAKDLLGYTDDGTDGGLHQFIREPIFADENEMINKLFDMMRTKKAHIAVVKDEFGGTAGIVTLEDILEEIVGEIGDEYDEETSEITERSRGEFVVNAQMSVADANDILPHPLPEDDDYETVGGMIIGRAGRIPSKDEKIELENYTVTIISGTKRKLDKIVLLERSDEDASEANENK